VHASYRSAGGTSTSFILHRRAQQNQSLPAPIPTMSSTEIKRQSKSKLVHSSRKADSATTDGIEVEEDYDGSISCPSIGIVSNISIPSLSTAILDETEIGEGKDTLKQSPGVYEGDVPNDIVQKKRVNSSCSEDSSNTVIIHESDGITTTISSCATTEESEKRGLTGNSTEEERELQNALHDEYEGNCVDASIVEDVENCIVRKNSYPLLDEGGFPHDGGGPIDNILLMNESTDAPVTHQKDFYETEKQSTALDEEDDMKETLLPRTDIILSNTVVIDKPASITTILASSAAASKINEERILLESCTDEQYQVEKAFNSEIDSIRADAYDTEVVENCADKKETYLKSDEGDFSNDNSDFNGNIALINASIDASDARKKETPGTERAETVEDTNGIERDQSDIEAEEKCSMTKKAYLNSDEGDCTNVNSESNRDTPLMNTSGDENDSQERNIIDTLKETNGKENSHEVVFEIDQDQYNVCQMNASSEVYNKHHCDVKKKDKSVRESIGKREYPVQEDPKIDLNNGQNADKSNGLAADAKHLEPLMSEITPRDVGYDLIASANTNILESSAPYGLMKKNSTDEESHSKLTSVSSNSTTERDKEQCLLKLSKHQALDAVSDEYNGGCTTSRSPKVLKKTVTLQVGLEQPKLLECDTDPDYNRILTTDTSSELNMAQNDVKSEEQIIHMKSTSGSNRIIYSSPGMKEGGISTTGLEFGNIGVTQSPWYDKDASLDDSESEGDHCGSMYSTGGVSSITGQSHMSDSTFSSIQSPTLHHLNYLAGKCSTTLFPSFTSPTMKLIEEDIIVHEILLSSRSQQKSNELLELLFDCRSREDAVSLAVDQAIHLNEAATALLHVLIEYVHKYCDVPLEKNSTSRSYRQQKTKPGLVLPATAIGWLSLQFDSKSDKEEQSREEFFKILSFPTGMKDKISHLKLLLTKCVNHLRITGSQWPPIHKKGTGQENKKSNRQGTARHYGRSGRKGKQLFRRNKSKANPPTDFEFHSAVSFLSYYRRLQVQPFVNMALFSNLRSLELDGVAPDLMSNLHLTKDTLLTMKFQRGCIFNVPRLLSYVDASVKGSQLDKKNSEINSQSLLVQSSAELSNNQWPTRQSSNSFAVTNDTGAVVDGLSKKTTHTIHALEEDRCMPLSFPTLQHLTLSHCGIGELAGLKGGESYLRRGRNDIQLKKQIDNTINDTNPTSKISPDIDIEVKGNRLGKRRKTPYPPLSLMKNLVTLDMSNNELVHSSTALAGLVALPKLSSINFSQNNLMSMKNAYLMLGNIKILTLSGNLLSNVDGLDRICSLERLDLDGNRIRRVCDMAGLANLPQLMHLSVKGNPIEKKRSCPIEDITFESVQRITTCIS